MDVKSKASEATADISALLRARNPLLWIVSREEARVEGYIFEAAASAGYTVRCWDVGQGVTGIDGKPQPIGSPDPGDTLRTIAERATSGRDQTVSVVQGASIVC